MEVIIMRGLPGAGKDYWLSRLDEYEPKGVYRCSADDFHTFTNISTGEVGYRYDPAKAGEAHNACLKKFAGALAEGYESYVVVSNTNTTAVEIAPYYQLALAYDLPVKIVHVLCDFETACHRNVHGVPPSTIWAMQRNLLTERLPAWWREEFVQGEEP